MRDAADTFTLADVYGADEREDARIAQILDRSLGPRGPELMYEKIGASGLDSRHRVLDVGCRDAKHACELASRFGCSVVGVDPVPRSLELARAKIAEAGVADRVDVVEGRIEAVPAQDEQFDFVWCRDMLNHVRDLDRAFSECARVLRRGGRMIIFHTFATDLLEPREAERLYAPVAVVAESMEPHALERALSAGGLHLLERDVVASEWREHGEEEGDRRTSRQLLRIARLRRRPDELRAELGEKAYEIELADCQWGVYQMLGKLRPEIWIAERRA